MKFYPQLLAWQLRRVNAITMLAVCIAGAWTMLEPVPLFRLTGRPSVFILVHGLALAAVLGRPGAGEFGFLYGRGHSRDALWGHTMLASLGSAVLTLLLPALLVWTGARSALHDHLFQSPDYPLMAAREWLTPLWWLAGYCWLLPVVHYAWIRAAVPVRGPGDGLWLSLGVLTGMALVLAYAHRFWWHPAGWCALGALTAASLTLLILGWRLHRRLEVQA